MAETGNLIISPAYVNLTNYEFDAPREKNSDSTLGSNLKLLSHPFRALALPNFLQLVPASNNSDGKAEVRHQTPDGTPSFLAKIRDEITDELGLTPKNNDLYQFSQSQDLKTLDSVNFPNLCKARDFFSVKVREWMSRVTGIVLRPDYVATTVSSYDYTDYLLCHDDELEERRVAFLLYLTPGWKKNDGGRLDLFSSDDKIQPVGVVDSIFPECNLLSMFEVTERSFHQVSEVTRDSRPRLSINGWFHGDPVPRSLPTSLDAEEWDKPTFVSYETVISWINPEYLNESVQKEIREKFENDSEIELQNFLQEEKYNLVFRECQQSKQFEANIVPNKRWYHGIREQNLEPESNLGVCLELFRSEAMFLLLSQLTGLSLHSLFNSEQQGGTQAPQIANSLNSTNGVESLPNPVAPTLVVSQAPTSPSSARKRRRSASPQPDSLQDTKRAKPEPENVLSPVYERQGGSEACNSRCLLEYRKFEHGSYTLMHDCEGKGNGPGSSGTTENDYSLDVQLFFTPDEWQTSNGGYTCYVAKGEDEELLTVTPKGNSLALVYRDPETLKFVKYVNHRVTKTNNFKVPGFHDLNATYISSL